eukprot:SAG31_NODE_2710_length_5214_cov_1.789628_2_plen_139_part_00
MVSIAFQNSSCSAMVNFLTHLPILFDSLVSLRTAAIGKNSRSFAAVDELVFQDAKSNPHYKAVYKVLVEMHEAFQKLDSRVTEGGRMTNEIDRLQARISDMAAKNDALDMKRILKDLKAIQKENESLLQNRSLLKPKK